jgi:8-oxo-dGTP pyrophosphatase MutT (NUDIX family)
MGYIEELRRSVGNRAIIMVGAGIILTDSQGQVLLGKRSDNQNWGIPGGSLEPGETLEDAARRETLEETGLEVGSMRLFDVFSGPQFFYTYPNGDQVHNVSVVYESSTYQGELRSSEEHLDWKLFAPGALPQGNQPARAADPSSVGRSPAQQGQRVLTHKE